MRAEPIVTKGHVFWIDQKGNEHAVFHKNEMGEKLKRIYDELKKPVKTDKKKFKLFVDRK